ncbi:MAG: DUF5662 family protein [Lachnospiraceae bacterium]|nr:DUF5662 family protein [Lachnospiraceae bacterium]
MEDSSQEGASKRITWRKAKGHLKTITEHKLYVMKECFQVGLYRQGLTHDLSKYLPTELLEGFRYYEDGTSSPNNGERRDKGYSEAWMHHKGRNRHHFEYWMDYREPQKGKLSKTAGPHVPDYLQTVQMPRNYVVEMLMDRIAASKNYNKEAYTQHDALAYFEKGMGHYLMHPQTKKELHGMLRILDERGEKELMRFVRDYYLKGYPI